MPHFQSVEPEKPYTLAVRNMTDNPQAIINQRDQFVPFQRNMPATIHTTELIRACEKCNHIGRGTGPLAIIVLKRSQSDALCSDGRRNTIFGIRERTP